MPEPSDSKYVLLILFIYLKIVQKQFLKRARARTEGELLQVQQHFLTKFSIKKMTLFQISDG